MDMVITTEYNEVIACIPIDSTDKCILRNGYKVYRDPNPMFTDKDGYVYYIKNDQTVEDSNIIQFPKKEEDYVQI